MGHGVQLFTAAICLHPIRQRFAVFFNCSAPRTWITVGATESGTAGCYLYPLLSGPMTRKELLRIVVLRARVHGFEFRQWFQTSLETEWPGFEQAVALLASGRRYYALLFSHDFAGHFWKKGTQITFLLPSQEYTASMPTAKSSPSNANPSLAAHPAPPPTPFGNITSSRWPSGMSRCAISAASSSPKRNSKRRG